MWFWRNKTEDRRDLSDYLANSLNASPEKSCHAWLELAEIHRQAGNKTEFDILSARLKENHNVHLPEWTARH